MSLFGYVIFNFNKVSKIRVGLLITPQCSPIITLIGWFWELRKSVLLQTKCVRHLFCPLCHHGCLRSHRGGFCFTVRQVLRFIGWNYCLDEFSSFFFDKVCPSFQVFFYAWLKIVDTRRVSNRTDVLSDHWYSILDLFEHKSFDLSNILKPAFFFVNNPKSFNLAIDLVFVCFHICLPTFVNNFQKILGNTSQSVEVNEWCGLGC